jgi:hypothetical protein
MECNNDDYIVVLQGLSYTNYIVVLHVRIILLHRLWSNIFPFICSTPATPIDYLFD